DVEALQKRIAATDLGKQEIRGDVFVTDSSGKVVLPRSFTFLGQRFAIDSWVLAKVVYDDITWQGGPVMRRVPSALDVAFAALGNDAAVPHLTERLTAKDGRRFRDGLNYQHNLAATRNVIDGRSASTWEESMYTGWLGALRELSRPADARAPESM